MQKRSCLPLLAMDPDMEAVIQIVPLIPLFFICRAAAWTDRNVPVHQPIMYLASYGSLTCDVDLHDPPKVLCGVVEGRDLLLNTGCSKESSDWSFAIIVDAFEGLAHRILICDVQLTVFNFGTVFLCSLLSNLPFSLGGTGKDIGTINMWRVGFKQCDGGCQSETPCTASYDYSGMGETE
jgi:hypothetical protein